MKRSIFLLFSLLLTIYITIIAKSTDVSEQIGFKVNDHIINGEREIAIIIPTYNNAKDKICLKNLQSVLSQSYEHFHVYIIDDNSTDETYTLLAAFINTHPRSNKVTLIRNQKRVGAMANYYHTIHLLEDHIIVLNVDGDDFLAHKNVLCYINNLYAHNLIWLTYGQYREFPSGTIGFCKGYPKDIIRKNAYRRYALPISHLRTYYAGLFKQIKKEDLMYNGRFVQAACDKVMMVPMIEMSGGRFICVQDILYIYNAINPISDMRVRGMLQARIRDKVVADLPYKPLAQIITDYAIDA